MFARFWLAERDPDQAHRSSCMPARPVRRLQPGPEIPLFRIRHRGLASAPFHRVCARNRPEPLLDTVSHAR
jgi:hypothetical protein